MTICRRAVAILVNTASILAVVVGAPMALLHYLGNPYTLIVEYLPEFDDQEMSPQRLTLVAMVFGWALWLLLIASLVIETMARLRGIRVPRLPGLRPIQALAAALVAGHTAGLLAPAIAVAAPATTTAQVHHGSATATATVATVASAATAAAQTDTHRPVTVVVGNTSYSYTVKRGDHLSKIAKAWLGDADRWPEICSLNKHRHFPTVGGTLRNCNLIYPGWDLRLPADARPPADATPAPPPATPKAPPVPPVPTGPPVAPPDASDDGVTPAQPTPNASTNPQRPASPSSSPTDTASPISIAVGETSAGSRVTTPATDSHGVQLPGGTWVTWTLAAAIVAAAALVWLQRRRRFTLEPDDDLPLTQLPPPVTQLRRAIAHRPQQTHAGDQAEQTAAPGAVAEQTELIELFELAAGGMGLQGEGAHAAARGAVVAALASGGPHHPDLRGEVVIDATTMTTLIGADAATLVAWPRLHLADNLDHALTIIEERLLHRSRILDQYSLSDLDTLRSQAPDEEALPPILLVCEVPPPGAQMRTKACLVLGAPLRVSGVLLGQWAHAATVHVAADGHTHLVAGPHFPPRSSRPIPSRLPVLPPDATVQILATLREAHTGQPPAATVTVGVGSIGSVGASGVALAASRTAPPNMPTVEPTTSHEAATAAATPGAAKPGAGKGKAQLCVLGPPRITDIAAPGRPLRAKALELAVYLACHPGGASTREIGEYLEPDARLSQADQRVHTNASNLRHNLARTQHSTNSTNSTNGTNGANGTATGYVVKVAGRYRLDPATVEVDVWRLRDLLRQGSTATGPRRRALLGEACDLYTAPLADGQDYEWINPHREAVRRWGIEAHLLLADDLLACDPGAASRLLDKAIGLDCYNEALYCKAMHARHALGDTDGIRTLLRALTRSLSDLDAEPEEETLALATKLRTSPRSDTTTSVTLVASTAAATQTTVTAAGSGHDTEPIKRQPPTGTAQVDQEEGASR
ncbi:MAG TPA: BTAD domain-containing putative transcriptional regulator [Candidatus Limnocylindrales bacterium]|nr:BTAD domain-containing putative transcriptional regulator [Candidatus Limnocylindrales bacterium]